MSLDGDALDMSALTTRQREVFGEVCVGLDLGQPPAVLRILEEMGLIVAVSADTLGPGVTMAVKRYAVPTDVYCAWTSWCAAQPDEPESRV